MMRRLLREILEGDVPTAWPKPAGSNGDKPKAQNILAQDSVINVNRRADADEDWDLLTRAHRFRRNICIDEVVSAFGWREFIEGVSNCPPEVIDGSGADLAENGFELGEDLFDGIEIGL